MIAGMKIVKSSRRSRCTYGGTEEVEMSFDASSIVSNACEDMYEDAYDDIGADAVAEMQRYLHRCV